MSEILTLSINILSYIFEGWCAVLLFDVFVKPKLVFVYSKYVVGIVWTVMCIALSLTGNSSIAPLIKLAVYIAVLTSFSLLWHKGKAFQKLVPVIQFIAIRELAFQATSCMLELSVPTVNVFVGFAENGAIAYEDMTLAVKVTVCVFNALIEVLKNVIIYLSVKRIAKSCRFNIRLGKEAFMYFLPSAVGVLLTITIRLMIITIENGIPTIAFQRYPALFVIIPIICLTLICLVIFSFKLYQEMVSLQRLQTEKTVLENQLNQMQNSITETERLYDNVRAVRHDMKNNLIVLRGLIAKKCPNDDEIGRYFEDMSLTVEQLDNRVKTGNAVCDTVISGKFRLAEKRIPNITLCADDFVCGESSIKSFDIGIILNNALDNAIEACERLYKKSPQAEIYIKLRSFKKRNLFFIEIKNSFDGTLKADEESGLFFSTKENTELHGIGLHNIKSCAEKYSGDVDFKITDDEFVMIVMLKST